VSDFDDLLTALEPVVAALRRLGVRHYVGGSVASTLHGAIRSTMDVDLVCGLAEPQVDAFIAACGDDVSKLVRLHGGTIDLDYLRTMADSIGVRDLLDRLLSAEMRPGEVHPQGPDYSK